MESIMEKEKLHMLASQLVAGGWRVIWWTKGHYNHLHVDTGKPGRVTL